MPLETLALAFFVTVAAGGVVWVFVYPLLSGERHAEKRVASVAKSDTAARLSAIKNVPKVRREQVEESLKELEIKQRKHVKLPVSVRIEQAGLSWSKRKFWLISAALGLGSFALVMVTSGNVFAALALAFTAGMGLPRWTLSYLKKRREAAFLNGLPDAVDVIVRGIKAGLPLLDCLKVIANDSPDPVGGEFKKIIDTQTIGIPIGEACAKLYDRMPVPEANFFGIVISIQQRSGGNLSEALGNLSRVLRDRKKMKAKVQAMSMEAKASAAIIGALPIIVMVLVYLSSPNYIELLWTTPVGRIMLAASGFWMLMGVLVMRKMINFDF